MNSDIIKGMSSTTSPSNLEKAKSFYLLACRRIGLPAHPIISSRCSLPSGVYLIYILRPVEAFQEFHQASVTYQLYLKSSHLSTKSTQSRRLEQKMYWSCFKSEYEILSEIPLLESGIADIEYPHMFPSPPEPTSWTTSPLSFATDISPRSSSFNKLGEVITTQPEQEQSWFYYLSEIALRRTGNLVLNAFYRDDHLLWAKMNVPSAVKVAEEFMHQLAEWHDGLPRALSYNQADLSDMPLDELPYMIRTRLLEIKSWIFRPFLYHTIHNMGSDEHRSLILPFAEQAIVYSIWLIEANSIRHRHHGTWYTCRVSASAALSRLAAAQSGVVKLAHGWQDTVHLAIETLRYWEGEAPGDLKKVRRISEDLLRQVV